MLAIVAPGQGAQTPGFLTPWLAESAIADRFNWLSAAADIDLVHYGTQADAETIRDTAIAQPLLVAAGLVATLAVFPSPSHAFSKVGVVAGHSVGELTAAAGTGVISAEAAMILVRERGKAMAKASAVTPTSMTAIIGGDRDEVLTSIEAHGLTAANNNGAGQIAAAGTVEQLQALAADPPRRTRLIPLSVAGAFHTRHMEPAVAHLARLAKAVSTRDPRTKLLSNTDGTVIADGREFLNRVVTQVANPVRWDRCMETMASLGVTGLLELPPSGTLTGIAKRNLKGVELFSLNTPDQLDDARTFVDNHADATDDLSSTQEGRMLVSPDKGQFIRADEAQVSALLASGTIVGYVHNLRGQTPITARHGGTIIEWLAKDGDLVNPGQLIVRLDPASEIV